MTFCIGSLSKKDTALEPQAWAGPGVVRSGIIFYIDEARTKKVILSISFLHFQNIGVGIGTRTA
jgi:hypothetical protein